MADNNFYCQLCDCTLHSKNEFSQHCNGKKHKSNEQLAHEQDVANRRLFVRGHEGMQDPMMLLQTHFLTFGRVENISFGGKHGSGFAIVEFSNPESVARALKVKHRFGGYSLFVKQYQHRPCLGQMSRLVQQELDQDEKTKQVRAKDNMMGLLLSALSVTDQINLVAQNLKLDTSDQNARAKICAELKKLFAPHFGSCSIYQFGSSVNGFGAKGCDLDLFLDLNTQNTSTAVSKSKVKKLGQIISASQHFSNTLTIPSHRCPVVRFAHKSTEIKCDLSINNRKALHNSYLLRLYSTEPRVHKLVSIIRLWARSLELAGSVGGAHLFTSYSITLIVLFFVMRREPKMVPLVCDIEKCIQGTRREMVDDWECIHVPSEASLPPSENNGTDLGLVTEFFEFYSSSVDWDRDALVMRDATIFPRSDISLDPNYIGCKAACMTVLDPFVLTHNVVGNVNAKTKERFVAELKRSAELISQWSVASPKPCPEPWGIAALLVPTPPQQTNTPGKKAGSKAQKALVNNQDTVGAGPAKVSTNRIEGEQENGDFCITVQPSAQTMLSAELLSIAKQNNVKSGEQWCILAQNLVLEVLQTVFMVEVEEVVTEEKEEVCLNVDTRQSGDEHLSEGCSKDQSNLTEKENCDNLVNDCECVGDGFMDIAMECDVQEGSHGKRTSDAAHLDGIITESMDDSTSDSSSLSEATVLNPKKRFCEGVTGNTDEILADVQVIDESKSVDKAVFIKHADEKHNSVCSVENPDDCRISFDDQHSDTVSNDRRDVTMKNSASIEAVPTSSGAKDLTAVKNPSSVDHIDRTTHSGALPKMKTLKIASYFCRCKHQLWIGRKKMTAELSIKHALTALELEQEISNLALKKQRDLIPRQELSKVQDRAVQPCHPLAQNNNDDKPQMASLKDQEIKDHGRVIKSGQSKETSVAEPKLDKETSAAEPKQSKETSVAEPKQNKETSAAEPKQNKETSAAVPKQNKATSAAEPNCTNNVQNIQHLVQFSCQFSHQNFDTNQGLPHILIKLRPAESSSNQFKNFYCSFRALVQNLIMKHFLEVYK